MLCPECHAEIPSLSRVCPQCGALLRDEHEQLHDDDIAAGLSRSDTQTRPLAADTSVQTGSSAELQTELLDAQQTELLGAAATETLDAAETELLGSGQTELLGSDETELLGSHQTELPGSHQSERLDDTAPRDPVVIPMTNMAQSISGEHDKPKKKRWGLIVLGMLAVIACIAAGLYFGLRPMFDSTVVPELAGQGRAEAVRLIEEAGLVAELSELAADDNFDTVINSAPVSGTTVDKGSTVTVIIAVPRIMPQLHGKTLEEATKILSDVGANNITTTYRHSSEPEGTVISATPAEGAQFRSSDEVVLVISKPYTVPDVVGLERDEAIRLIEEAELSYKVEQVEGEDKAGTVLATDPVAQTRMSRGQTVILTVVAAGPRSETYLPDYIREDPSDVHDYLTWKGWNYSGAGFGSLTSANERWSKEGVGTLLFTPTPENGDYVGIGLSGSTSLGSEVQGVRFEPVLSNQFEGAALTEEYLQQCAYRCGLGELTEFVTDQTVVRPQQNSGFSFDFGSGWGFGRPRDNSSNSSSAGGFGENGEQSQNWDSNDNSQNSSSSASNSSPAFLAGVAEGETLYWYLSVNADAYGNASSLTVAVGKRSNLEGKSLSSYGDSLASYLAAQDHYGE